MISAAVLASRPRLRRVRTALPVPKSPAFFLESELFPSIIHNNNCYKMKEIKNLQTQERQAYVPASMKVIEVTARGVLCSSGENTTGFGDDFNDGGSF